MQSAHNGLYEGGCTVTSQLYPWIPALYYAVPCILIYLRDKQWHTTQYLSSNPACRRNNPKRIEPSLCSSVGRNLQIAFSLALDLNVAICTYNYTTLAFVPRMSEIWQVWQQSRLRVPWLALAEPSSGSVGARSHRGANRVLLYWQKRWRANSLSGLSWASKWMPHILSTKILSI